MAQPSIQTSFASGEWAAKLRSRVDVQKYRSGAGLLRNFYVDFSGGGASTRPGTKYILRTRQIGARLIPFQPSSNLSYVLEMGQNYIRFLSNGAYILENAITGGTGASGDTFTITNTLSVGDWVLATGWGGMTNVNGNYFLVSSASGSAVSVTDLYGNAVTFTGTYTSGGQLQRVYTISTPYAGTDLFPNQASGNPGLKWVQDATSMIFCHPSYAPTILTINSANSWSLVYINFGATIGIPSSVSATTTLGAGTWNYAYQVTAVDQNGQESPPSSPGTISNVLIITSNAGTNTVTWTAVAGAVSYNIYKAFPIDGAAIAGGAQYGFVANVTGTSFQDSTPGITPDVGQTPPIPQNPFFGASVINLILTVDALYTSPPSVTIAAPPSGITATGYASLALHSVTPDAGGWFFKCPVSPIGQIMNFNNGVALEVTSAVLVGSNYNILAVAIASGGSITSGTAPSTLTSNNPPSSLTYVSGFANIDWDIGSLNLIQGGQGYTSAPTVTIPGGASAISVLGPASAGNPGVPGFLQERLMLGAQQKAVQSYNLSQPGSFFNFNVSNPSEPDDAISGTIISEELNDIRSLIPVPTGMIALTGKGAWLINGGGGLSTLNPITPSNQTASPQAFNGANDLRPQKVNLDVIYGTNKGSYFRDLSYNIYANIYTGADISVLSNHLFFGFNFLDVAWAEEPFKTMWFVRNDGTLVSLGFVKDQDLIGWAHHDTNGQFKSVCSVIETIGAGNVVDAVYVIVNRFVNNQFVEYVERFDSRYFNHGYIDAWCVDAGLQTVPNAIPAGELFISGNATAIGNSVILGADTGTPFNSGMVGWRVDTGDGAVYKIATYVSGVEVTATVIRPPNWYNLYTGSPFVQANNAWAIWQPVTVISGLQHLIGQTVTGLADGAVVPPTVVAADGSITLGAAACKVTLGLAFLPQLRTLPLDLGEPTVQGKRKKIAALTLRVADTLGLQAGTTFANAVTMKDFQIGAIPTTSNGPVTVTDLVNPSWSPDTPVIDGRLIIDQVWQEAGNYCIQQNLPYPATILGVMPEVVVGDTK